MKKNKSTKGFLVKGYVPPISRHFIEFAAFREELKKILKRNAGIYVLYKDEKLYYVGLTKDLFWRLHHHTKDKHKNKWNKFSAFIIRRGNYLKDLESMTQLISEPPANIWKGRFKEHYKYDKQIKLMVKDLIKVMNDISK